MYVCVGKEHRIIHRPSPFAEEVYFILGCCTSEASVIYNLRTRHQNPSVFHVSFNYFRSRASQCVKVSQLNVYEEIFTIEEV